MATSSSALSQAANAQLGIPLPANYGFCRLRGDNILLNQLSSKNRVGFWLLGEGPYDGIERLWINKKLVNISDTTLVHFHPGTDGTLGSGLNPTSLGGDQLVDQFFSQIPANFQPLTYSRIAYLALNVPPDPGAPDANLDVVGDYRCLKVRIFDTNGNQTAFQFSTNPAWQVLDMILRKMINPEWTVAAASAAGGDLTAQQKARINFPAVVSAAAWCDAVIPNGQKRFESSIAFVQTTKLQQSLSQLLAMGQLYITEEDGQIFILPDQPRASTFTLTADHVVAGTFDPNKTSLRGAGNRLVATFNDLNPTDSADIDTQANNGLVRSGNIVTVKTKAQHPYLQNDNVQIMNPLDASFAGVGVVLSVPDNFHFTFAQNGPNATSGGGYTGTPESRFAQRGTAVDHERHQNAIGARGLNLFNSFRRLPVNLDLGNNTMERAMRILNFLKARNLGLDQTPYQAPWRIKVSTYADAVDANMHSLIEQINGDIVTIDSTVSEEFQGQYEIMKHTLNLPGLDSSTPGSSGGAKQPTIDLELLQYMPGAFSDVATIVNGPSSSPVRLGVPPIFLPGDNLIVNGGGTDGRLGSPANSWMFGNGNALTCVTEAARFNFRALQINNVAAADSFSSQTVSVTDGQLYKASCWIKTSALLATDPGQGAVMHIACGGGVSSLDVLERFSVGSLSIDSTDVVIGIGHDGVAHDWTYVYAIIRAHGTGSLNVYCQLGYFGAQSGTAWFNTVTVVPLLNNTKVNPVDATGLLTGPSPLSQNGTSTLINVSAWQIQFGNGAVSYNSGSVDPGAYGTWGVYTNDLFFKGGAVIYKATQSAHTATSDNSVVSIGQITTAAGGGGTGTGGGTGGSGFGGSGSGGNFLPP